MENANEITLKEYTDGINRILLQKCERINKKNLSPFLAVHHPVPEAMAKFYYDSDMSVEDAADSIRGD